MPMRRIVQSGLATSWERKRIM